MMKAYIITAISKRNERKIEGKDEKYKKQNHCRPSDESAPC